MSKGLCDSLFIAKTTTLEDHKLNDQNGCVYFWSFICMPAFSSNSDVIDRATT